MGGLTGMREVVPAAQKLAVTAVGGSVVTPPDGITAEVVAVPAVAYPCA